MFLKKLVLMKNFKTLFKLLHKVGVLAHAKPILYKELQSSLNAANESGVCKMQLNAVCSVFCVFVTREHSIDQSIYK